MSDHVWHTIALPAVGIQSIDRARCQHVGIIRITLYNHLEFLCWIVFKLKIDRKFATSFLCHFLNLFHIVLSR